MVRSRRPRDEPFPPSRSGLVGKELNLSEQLDHPVYFLTWTTYGSWLPGDERGWVNRESASPTAPVQEADLERHELAESRMSSEAVLLNNEQRSLVEDTIRDVCDHRGWTQYAVNARTNHVHSVLLATDREPEIVMNSLKSWCSRRLNESWGTKRNKPWWTRHGSTRWLNAVAEFERTVDYVLNQQ